MCMCISKSSLESQLLIHPSLHPSRYTSSPWRSYHSYPCGQFGDSRVACWRPCCLPVDRTGSLLRLGVWLRLGQRLHRPELCGSNTYISPDTSAVVQPEEIPALATASITEVLVCWNAFILNVCLPFCLCLLSPLSQIIHLSLSGVTSLLPLHFPFPSPPSSQIIASVLFHLFPILSLFFCPFITWLSCFLRLTFSLSFFPIFRSHVLIHN